MGDSPAVHMWQEEWGAHAIPSTVRLLCGVLVCERSSVGDSPAVHM